MSLKENYWSNVPQKSFFGHMKDEYNITNCDNLEDLKGEID